MGCPSYCCYWLLLLLLMLFEWVDPGMGDIQSGHTLHHSSRSWDQASTYEKSCDSILRGKSNTTQILKIKLRNPWTYDWLCERHTAFIAEQFNWKFPLYPFYFYACSPKDGHLTGHNRLLLSQVSPACFLYLWIGNGLKAPVLWRSQGQLAG